MKTNNTFAPGKPLTAALMRNIDGWERAANYLSVGQIYLYDNPLLKQPLKLALTSPRHVCRDQTCRMSQRPRRASIYGTSRKTS